MSQALLLSGGMDSIALAFQHRPELAITIDYGQRAAEGEIRAARAVARRLEILHEVVSVDCSSIGSGDLAGSPPLEIAPVPEWWPFRNQLLVTIAAARSVSRGADRLLIGTVRSDSKQHRDGTEAFIEGMDRLLALQEGGLRLSAPAIMLNSADLIREAKVPRTLMAFAHSCHTAAYACGTCRGCAKHREVTEDLWGEAY